MRTPSATTKPIRLLASNPLRYSQVTSSCKSLNQIGPVKSFFSGMMPRSRRNSVSTGAGTPQSRYAPVSRSKPGPAQWIRSAHDGEYDRPMIRAVLGA